MGRGFSLSSPRFVFKTMRWWLTCAVFLVGASACYAVDRAEQARLEREVKEAANDLLHYCTTGDVWRFDNLRPTILRAVAPFGTLFNPPEVPVVHLSPGSPFYRPIVGEMVHKYWFYASRKQRLDDFLAGQQNAKQPPIGISPPSLADVDSEMRNAERALDNARACYGRACGWGWPYINLRPRCRQEGFEPAVILNPFIPVPTTRLSEANPDYRVIIAALDQWGPRVPKALAQMRDLRNDRTDSVSAAASLHAAGHKVEPIGEKHTPKNARLAELFRMYLLMKPALRQWRKDQYKIEDLEVPLFVATGTLAKLQLDAAALELRIFKAEHDRRGRYIGPAPGLRQLLAGVMAQIVATKRELQKIQYEIQKLRQDQAALAGQMDALTEPWLKGCDLLGRCGPEVHKASLPLLDRFITDEPRLWQVYLARGVARLHAGQFEEALVDLQRVECKLRLYKMPSTLIALSMGTQACVLCEQGLTRRGMRRFTTAQRQDRRSWKLYLMRGWCHLHVEKYDSARNDFKRALKLCKKSPRAEACESMAILLAACPDEKIRDKEEALKQAALACDLTKNKNWVCLDTLGAAQAANGDFKSAVESTNKALARAPDKGQSVVQRHADLYQQKRPFRFASSSKPKTQPVLRTWTDRTGKYHLKATFVGLQNGEVTLKKKDGTLVSLSLEKLSDDDKRYVKRHAAEKDGPSPKNPLTPRKLQATKNSPESTHRH